MNTCYRLWSLGLGLMAACPVLLAQPLPWPADTAPAESVLKKTARLIREDAGIAQGKAPASREQGAKSGEPNLAPEDNPENVVVLDTMVVREKKALAIPPALHETPVAKYLRTGNFWQRIGHRFTSEIFCRPDKGIGLSFSW